MVTIVAVAFAAPASAGAQTGGDDPAQRAIQEQMCAEVGCQKNLRVTLRNKDGTLFDKTFEAFPPVIQEAGITVMGGQTVYVEADVEDGRLVHMKAVDAIVAPEKTLTAKFWQIEDGGMMLRIENPFADEIKFDMGIMPLDKDELYKTSSCPVGKSSYESWPEPIFLVVLANGRVADPDDGVCR